MALLAEDGQLPGIIPQLEPYRDRVIVPLEAREQAKQPGDHTRDVAGMLLFRFAPNENRGTYLRELLLQASNPERVAIACDCLATHPEFAGLDQIDKILANGDAEPAARLRAACAVVALEPDRLGELDAVIPSITLALLDERGQQIPGWLKLLGTAQVRLVAPLEKISADPMLHSPARATAAEALSLILMYMRDSDRHAADVVNSQPDAARILLRELASRGQTGPAVAYFKKVLDRRVETLDDEKQKDELAAQSALAAIGLETLGEAGAVSRLLSRSEPDPRVRALLIHRQAELGMGRPQLLERLGRPDVNPAERQALLLIWSETQLLNLSAAVRGELTRLARSLFTVDPDAGVHSAAELLLRRLGREDLVSQSEQELRRRPPGNPPMRWTLGPEGHTFAIISAPPVFLMGSPDPMDGPPQKEERLHYRSIDRNFAVATKEVSIVQYRRFDPDAAPDHHFTHDLRCPVNGVNWYRAARYCNWLSKQAGIPKDQWCYPEPIEPGMVLPEGSVERTGYRLPTEAEWEYVCRAGTITPRFFGSSEELMSSYACTWLNSNDRVMPSGRLLPNPLGMFDILGNLWEWCHDGPEQGRDLVPYPTNSTRDHPVVDRVKGGQITRTTYRILRGGAFDYSPAQARSAYRYSVGSYYDEGTFGFRVVRTLPAAGKP